jgi:hypothetical protein
VKNFGLIKKIIIVVMIFDFFLFLVFDRKGVLAGSTSVKWDKCNKYNSQISNSFWFFPWALAGAKQDSLDSFLKIETEKGRKRKKGNVVPVLN